MELGFGTSTSVEVVFKVAEVMTFLTSRITPLLTSGLAPATDLDSTPTWTSDLPDLRFGEDVTTLAKSLPYFCLCQTRIMLNNDSTWSIQSSA